MPSPTVPSPTVPSHPTNQPTIQPPNPPGHPPRPHSTIVISVLSNRFGIPSLSETKITGGGRRQEANQGLGWYFSQTLKIS
ncbi:hypothetical protein Pmani_033206 [Petrolisthes manimaculis]|uniref:Uncharacterized protein n=1 Tax=Petrolisthes manimaculis TaxID=1843537 RepID=A0AAE1NRR3_9EUCA|nr:hypothetical protein Pmani_033206 [Petrolisthes manimaculis]